MTGVIERRLKITPPHPIFPVTLSVIIDAMAQDPDPAKIPLVGPCLYVGKEGIWIVEAGNWTRWEPENPKLLDVFGDQLYAAPCAKQGITFVTSVKEHGSCLSVTRKALGLTVSDDLAGSLHKLLKSTLLETNTATPAVRVKAEPNISQPSTSTSLPPTRIKNAVKKEEMATIPQRKKKESASTKKRKGNVEVERNQGSTSRIDKGKRKASPEAMLVPKKVEGAALEVVQSSSREAKRRKTTPIMHPLLMGITCPSDTPTVEWPNLGVITHIPWFSDMDRKTVEIMAKSLRAQDRMYEGDRPMVVEIEYNENKQYHLGIQIEAALAQGSAVLVRGWQPTSVEFNLMDIRNYRPTTMQTVIVQDAVKRAAEQKKAALNPEEETKEPDIFRKLSLQDFIGLADIPDECMNLLDLPNYQPDVPMFLRHVPHFICRGVSDNVNARSVIMNDRHLDKRGKNMGKDFYGVQFITGDTERVRGWDLLTHGGFLTYPHHDASGFATYVTVRSGTKIWAYLDTPTGNADGSTKLFKGWDGIYQDTSVLGSPEAALGALVLSRGDTLIQPPGSNHMVYSPQDGVTSGGHFLCYNSMHLTELALRYDSSTMPDTEYERGTISTNANHPSLHRYVTWMVLGLPYFAKDLGRPLYRRPLLALISLFEKKAEYIGLEEHNVTAEMREGDYFMKEILNERAKAKEIIELAKKELKVTDVKVELEKGKWWDKGPAMYLQDVAAKFTARF